MIGSPAPLGASPFEVSIPIVLPPAIRLLPVFPTLPIGFPVRIIPTMAAVRGGTKIGRDMRAPQQQLPVWEFEINLEVLRDQTQNAIPFSYFAGFTDFTLLSQLFISSVGQYGQFLFDAWWDDSRTDQAIASGDGVSTKFTVVRTWGSGLLQFTEPVGSVNVITNVKLNGVVQDPASYFISGNNYLNFLVAPASGVVITATFSFYYLCQFAEDQQTYSEFMKNRWTAKIKFRSVLQQSSIGSPEGPSFFSSPAWPPLPSPPPKFYIETTITAMSSQADACIGVANAAFNLVNPISLDLSAGAYAGLNGGAFMAILGYTSGGSAWSGLPGGHPAPFGAVVNGAPPITIGMVIDSVTRLAWWRASTAPTTWFGAIGILTPDPVAEIQGYPLADAGIGPNDPLFILLGAGQESGNFAVQTINFGATAFGMALPVSCFPYGSGAVLNPSDKAPLVNLSNGNLTMTTGVISGSNQPTAFVRGLFS